jgi:hypothetical protein
MKKLLLVCLEVVFEIELVRVQLPDDPFGVVLKPS